MPQTTDATIGGRRVVLPISAAGAAGPAAASSDDDSLEFDECRACYGVAVACVSLLLFCVLAASVAVTKACAVSGLAVLLFGIVGWFVPFRGASRGGGARGSSTAAAAAAAPAPRRLECACGLAGASAVDVPPSFAYECGPAAGEGGGALCAVCLEDVRRGEAVRRLPACRHLFHRECIDMWLHSHTTCPLCRCQLVPRTPAAKAKMAAVAESSSADALPPV